MTADARRDARRYAADLVPGDDPNMERERQLVEDEDFQTLAVAAKQLDIMDIYGTEQSGAMSEHADTARRNLGHAMAERAETVLGERVDGRGVAADA